MPFVSQSMLLPASDSVHHSLAFRGIIFLSGAHFGDLELESHESHVGAHIQERLFPLLLHLEVIVLM